MDDVVLLYTTWPDAETAEAAGAAAVEGRLAACANVLAPMTAVYRWEGEVRRETEIPMLLKTTRAGAERLRDWLVLRHPYDTPCIVAIDGSAGGSHADFLRWIGQEVAPGR